MKRGTDLADLIKSMTRSEKRYFKLYASRSMVNGESSYIALFDLLEKDPQMTSLPQNQRDNRIFRQLYVYRHRLYELILKSLNTYHSGRSVESELRDLLGKIEVLYNKTLYSAAMKLLLRAKKLASKYECLSLIPELMQAEKKILNADHYESASQSDIDQLFEAEEKAYAILSNANHYWKTFSTLYILYQKGMPRSLSDRSLYDRIICSPQMTDVELALSTDAKKRFYITHTVYNLALENLSEAYHASGKLVALLESSSDYLQNNLESYSSALSNLGLLTRYLNKYEEFFNIISKLRSLLSNKKFEITDHIKAFILKSTLNMELLGYQETGQFKKGISLVPEVEKLIRTWNLPSAYTSMIHYNIALLYFGEKDYKKAAAYLNLIVNNKEIREIAPEKYSFGLLLQLILHYEMGNRDILPYLVKTAYHDLVKKKKLYKAEAELIRFIRLKIPYITTKKDEVTAFNELKNNLTEICRDPLEAIVFKNSFDLISWLESKIENRPLETILSEKTKSFIS